MNQNRPTSALFISYLVVIGVFSVLSTNEASAASASNPPRESQSQNESQSESINELYEKTKKEGGQLTLYIALSARSEEIILRCSRNAFPPLQ
jgi:hypothetical protein